MTDYSERIPAAIARAKEGVQIHERTICASHDGSCVGCVQNAAVGPLAPVLAEALWGLHVRDFAVHVGEHDCAGNEYGPCQALAAFCEKMEGLSHD